MTIKRDAVYVVIIALLATVCAQFYYAYHYLPQAAREVNVYYNYDIAANEEVIRAIQHADQFVYFAIYTFTRTDIKDALLGAKYRGLDVRGVIDQEQTDKLEQQLSIAKELQTAGIPLAFDNHDGIMHLKTLVTDKSYVSGSYNWTLSATTSNDEVLEVGRDENLRRQYEHLVRKLYDKYQP